VTEEGAEVVLEQVTNKKSPVCVYEKEAPEVLNPELVIDMVFCPTIFLG
jgi:hypothetical protein